MTKTKNKTTEKQGTFISCENITKDYPGVRALDSVNFQVNEGEVHCLVGKNGAGKSTLIEIIAGTRSPTKGSIIVDGQEENLTSYQYAQELGISIVHQEPSLFPFLTVAENIYIGGRPTSSLGFVDYKEMRKKAVDILRDLNIELDPTAKVSELGMAKKQLVAIARALSQETKLLILDEPSAVLTRDELERLYEVIERLKTAGSSVIYISHRLREIFEIGDRVTILRDGELITTDDVDEVNMQELVKSMTGEEIAEKKQSRGGRRTEGEKILEIKDLSYEDRISNLDISLNKGEVCSIYGLVGSGKSLLAHIIFGDKQSSSGEILYKGEKVEFTSPYQAKNSGIAFVPKDRNTQAIFPRHNIVDNVSLPSLQKFLNKFSLLDFGRMNDTARRYVDILNIVLSSLRQNINSLSGGNQQKIILARWLAAEAELMVLDEPTRGIDVEVKEEMHELIEQQAEKGKAILTIHTEAQEAVKSSDRVLLMQEGTITNEFKSHEIEPEKLIELAESGRTE